MFYNNHGENINSSGNEISWTTNTFDGCAIVDRKLKVGDEIEIEIDGGSSGGHVLLGITTCTGNQIKESNKRGTKIDAFATTLVKVLKDKASFRLEVTSDSEMVQELRGQVSKIPVKQGYTYRLCAMLLFGFMDVKIMDGRSKWCSDLCGTNVSLSKDKKNASLKHGNPHAVCALSDALVQNNAIGFYVAPVDARWYYLKIFVSSMSPCEATAQGWERSVNNELTKVVKIKNPKEQLIITLSESTLTFVVGINSIHSYSVNIVSDKPTYLYIELFRVKLRVKAKEDIEDYEAPYISVSDPAIYEIPPVNVDPVLKVWNHGEVQTSERASSNLDRLKDVVSNRDTESSKLSDIYEYIKKFDKDLSSVECQYQGPGGARSLPEIPPSPKLKHRPSNISSDSGIGSTSSVCSTCRPTSNIADGATNNPSSRPMRAEGTTYDDARVPQLPTIYVRGGNEDLKSMIKDLKKRVSTLERMKKITIASSVDLYL